MIIDVTKCGIVGTFKADINYHLLFCFTFVIENTISKQFLWCCYVFQSLECQKMFSDYLLIMTGHGL